MKTEKEKWLTWAMSKIEDMNESQLKKFEMFLLTLFKRSERA